MVAKSRQVIVVSGILGSELYSEPFVSAFQSGSGKIWRNYLAIARGKMKLLGLAADGVSPGPGGIPIFGGPPLGGVYGQLFEMLRRNLWTVQTYSQDWRLSLMADAKNLAALIRSSPTWWPVNCIGHSRGGLVLRAALNMLTPAERAQMIGNCIGLGVPHWGSWEGVGLVAAWSGVLPALRAVLYTLTFLSLKKKKGGVSENDAHFADIMEVIVTWPGAYELFPAPGAIEIPPDDINQIYNPVNWSHLITPPMLKWILAAQSNWAAIGPIPSDVRWLSIYGYGKLTKLRYLPNNEFLNDTDPYRQSDAAQIFADGDGTVPTQWARYNLFEQQLAVPAAHTPMVYDGRLSVPINFFLNGNDLPVQSISGTFLDTKLPF